MRTPTMHQRRLIGPSFVDAYSFHRDRDIFYNQILTSPHHHTLLSRWSPRTGWSPDVDMSDRETEIVVRADLPGVLKEDIDVSLIGDMLVISGERKAHEEEVEEDYYHQERYYGRFQRSVLVPAGIDMENIKSFYNKGILEIVLPKKEKIKRKKIEIIGE
jgi:HSP20 family protein